MRHPRGLGWTIGSLGQPIGGPLEENERGRLPSWAWGLSNGLPLAEHLHKRCRGRQTQRESELPRHRLWPTMQSMKVGLTGEESGFSKSGIEGRQTVE